MEILILFIPGSMSIRLNFLVAILPIWSVV